MTSLWRIDADGLRPLGLGQLATEDQLESWIVRDPSILGLDIVVIGRQVPTAHGGLIDVLGLDTDGSLVIVELKRDRTPREVVAQVLDYASWVCRLTTREIHDLAPRHLGRPLAEAFAERFGAAPPETLNGSHSMLIVASRLDPSSQRIVQYLAERHGLGINTAFFNVFEDADRLYLSADWLLDQEEVEERAKRQQTPWTGFWYVNVGDGPDRAWADMRRYGFVAAGNGRRYSAPLERLRAGDPVFAYHKGKGYVGYGVVRDVAVMAKDFMVDGKPLLAHELVQPNLGHHPDDPELAEYVVPVEWKTTFDLSAAKWRGDLFANQNIVCRLRHPATLDFVRQEFGLTPS